ncbi:MAG: class I SAM-dependent methyltransferase [Bacteriovoracaceae bacterium]|nr:class I SAM-dependent methyltransferase [Bacteriovoracaceae bacterium]
MKFIEGSTLPPGKIGLDSQGPLLGAMPGQTNIRFSWNHHIHAWRRDSLIMQGKAPLFKALGVRSGDSVIDATMGLGRDCSQLIAAGLKVVAYERVPDVYFLGVAAQIFEGLSIDRLKLNFGPCLDNPDSLPIFFDPMFSDGKKRRAKPNKGMEVFHQLVGGDEDSELEAQRLLQLTKRLVIKRPPKGDQLLKGRNSCWESKALRLDLYLN